MKYININKANTDALSLPARERGLKSIKLQLWDLQILSLPARERGLKSIGYILNKYLKRVAPRTGAWIEITAEQHKGTIYIVAPRTGAWIEIENSRTGACGG